MSKLNHGDGLKLSLEILVLVHRHFKAVAEEDVYNYRELRHLMDLYLDRQEKLKDYDIESLFRMLSDTATVVEGLDQMGEVIIGKLLPKLNSGRYNDEIVEAYIALEDLHPLVEEKVKDCAMNVGLDCINKTEFFDRIKEWFGNKTKMTKYSGLFAKAFDSSVKD